MLWNSLLKAICRPAVFALLNLGMSQCWATPTSLEITGVLLDGSGNPIRANFISFTEGIYKSASGGMLLAQLGPENVQVNNGFYLQVFGLDDSLFDSTTYLQVNLNGFDMPTRLGIFYNGTYFFASGEISGPAGTPLFQLYAGLSAPPQVPEPSQIALMLGGLALCGLSASRRSGRSTGRLAPAPIHPFGH